MPARPRVRKNPAPGPHTPHQRWPQEELRGWLIELMVAFEGNILQASKAVGRRHQAIDRWLRVHGINHRDYYPAERFIERRGRIVGLRISGNSLAVSLVRDDTGKPVSLWVPATRAWRRQLTALFGLRVIVTGVFDRKAVTGFSVRSFKVLRGRAVMRAGRSGRGVAASDPDAPGADR